MQAPKGCGAKACRSRAGQILHNLRWFEVTETRGHIEGGRVAHYQVGLKVGFSLDENADAG